MKLPTSSITQQEAFMLLEMKLIRNVPKTGKEIEEYMDFARVLDKAVIEKTRKKPVSN